MSDLPVKLDTQTIANALVDAGPTRIANILNRIGFLMSFDGKADTLPSNVSAHLNRHGRDLARRLAQAQEEISNG